MRITKNAWAIAIAVLVGVNTTAQEKKEADSYLFTNKIFLDATPIKNQQRTGTCWSFCTTSFLESELIRMGKPSIDLSEMFNVRMNYIDKADNYVLRQGKAQFSEGGLSHDVMNSVRKYGLMPETAYPGNIYDPETHNHGEMAAVLESTVKTIVTNPNRKLTPVWQSNITAILDTYMGKSPQEFTFDGKSFTPKSFVDFLGVNPDDYITFTSFSHAPFYAPYVLQVPDNWSNGAFYNLPLEEMMQTIDYALENGFTIAWDTDVSEKTWSRKHGIAIIPETPYAKLSAQERDDLFTQIGPELEITQEVRQQAYMNYQTTDDHLMHIIGTAVDQNGNEYYLVKNSWGSKRAFDGYVYVSKPYMAMKTMGIMMHKDGVSKSISKKIKLN